MASLQYDYRTIPSITDDDFGGDDLYLGTSVFDGGDPIGKGSFQQVTQAGDNTGAPEPIVVGKQWYSFCFWNVTTEEGAPFDGFVTEDLNVKMTETATANLVATAWYQPVGGIGGPPGPPSVRALAFDRTANRFFRATPIASVSPEFAWPGGNAHSVATSESDVTVTARQGIEIHAVDKLTFKSSLSGIFESWRVGRAAPVGDPLALPRGAGGVAIAIYKQVFSGRLINTIPYWLFKLLHGIIDDEVLAQIRRPKGPSDGHGFGHLRPIAVDVERTMEVLRRTDRSVLELIRAHAGASAESTRTVLEIADRVAEERGGG